MNVTRRDSALTMNRQSTTTTLDPMAAGGFTATAPLDNAPVFLRAMRHSRRVRVLRWAIPAGVAAILVAVTLSTYLDPLRVLARLPGSASSGDLACVEVDRCTSGSHSIAVI